jgi:hypothetical protein
MVLQHLKSSVGAVLVKKALKIYVSYVLCITTRESFAWGVVLERGQMLEKKSYSHKSIAH